MDVAFFVLLSATLFLAFSNGANDNFKGVATLYGSGLLSFRLALSWATITTFAGSLASIFFGQKLITLFSGSDLVPQETLTNPNFLTAVVLGAALTVFTTARAGIPISTTHALTGALAGAGFAAAPESFNFIPLYSKFLVPLATAPLIPVLLIGGVLPAALKARRLSFWLNKHQIETRFSNPACREKEYRHRLGAGWFYTNELKLNIGTIRRLRDLAHIGSAGAVSFGRGLNDTPKMVGILLLGNVFGFPDSIVVLVGLAIAGGGILYARRVAMTMSKKITDIAPREGVVANVITSFLVLVASRYGLPVSTTHVSVGAIFGIGVANQKANWRLIGGIVSAWLLTLPVAVCLAAFICFILEKTATL